LKFAKAKPKNLCAIRGKGCSTFGKISLLLSSNFLDVGNIMSHLPSSRTLSEVPLTTIFNQKVKINHYLFTIVLEGVQK